MRNFSYTPHANFHVSGYWAITVRCAHAHILLHIYLSCTEWLKVVAKDRPRQLRSVGLQRGTACMFVGCHRYDLAKHWPFYTYPEAWTETVIYPLHKKGSIHEPDNYRGISLLNVCSKLYSYIINERLSRWAEDSDVLGEIQAGFRKDHSTTDYIFTLFSMIQRHVLRNKKSHAAFTDFRKSFWFNFTL